MGRRFTESDIKYLKANYPKLGAGGCASYFGKSPECIKAKASKLGIRSNSDGKYQKGIRPWNQGMKYGDDMKSRLDTSGLITTGKKGALNPNWLGDKCGYMALHNWIRRQLGNADKYGCIHCHKPAKHWANVDGNYQRNLLDFMPMCVSDHRKYDLANKG